MDKNIFNNIMDSIELDDESKKRILCDSIHEKRAVSKAVRYSRYIAAASIMGVFLLSSMTVYAAVSAYNAYMEQMSPNELEQRYEAVNKGKKDADTFSRALTKEERERLKLMRNLYWKGERFPEENMLMLDGSKIEWQAVQKPFYDYRNMIFYIPEDNLTDEQLLEIVDIWEKGNYSLTSINSTNALTNEEAIENAVKEMDKWKHTVELSEKEKIKLFTEEVFYELYGNKFSMADWEISSYGDKNYRYMVKVRDEKEYATVIFAENSTPDCLKIDSLNHSYSGNEPVSVKISEAEAQKQIEENADRLMNAIADSFFADGTQLHFSYGYNSSDMKYYDIVYEDEIGNRCRCTISFADGGVREVMMYEAGKYDNIDILSYCDIKKN